MISCWSTGILETKITRNALLPLMRLYSRASVFYAYGELDERANVKRTSCVSPPPFPVGQQNENEKLKKILSVIPDEFNSEGSAGSSAINAIKPLAAVSSALPTTTTTTTTKRGRLK